MGGLFARRLPTGTVLLISQAVGFGMLLVLATLRGPPTMDGPSVAYAMAASVTGLTGIAALYRGMAVGLVSIVAPISATGAALPVVYGIAARRAADTAANDRHLRGPARRRSGIALPTATRTSHGAAPVVARGVGLAIVAAVCFGAFFILMHQAATADVLWAIAIQRMTGVSILSLLALARRTPISVSRRQLGGLAAVGVLDSGANVLYAPGEHDRPGQRGRGPGVVVPGGDGDPGVDRPARTADAPARPRASSAHWQASRSSRSAERRARRHPCVLLG